MTIRQTDNNPTAAKSDADNRVQVSVFITPAIKARLEDAARANFRTASSEAAFRIAQSFANEGV